jgi:CxC4 like cysteine cluster associated with KDZ transposases
LASIADDPGFSDLPDLPNTADIDDASIQQTIANFESDGSAPFPRAVSHLPIQAPVWCRLPGDREDPTIVPFQSGQNLPQLFTLDATSRCSCGYTGTYDEDAIREDEFKVYASSTAFSTIIQTVYCEKCPNTKGKIGPDLGNYSVFNYNNQWGFSHELLNGYTSRLISHGETTFTAFHQTITHAYLEYGSQIGFCDVRIFENAWFAFVRLQELDTNMQCSICGPNPSTIIADGVAVSFSKKRLHDLPPSYPSCDR